MFDFTVLFYYNSKVFIAGTPGRGIVTVFFPVSTLSPFHRKIHAYYGFSKTIQYSGFMYFDVSIR